MLLVSRWFSLVACADIDVFRVFYIRLLPHTQLRVHLAVDSALVYLTAKYGKELRNEGAPKTEISESV